MTLDDKVHDRSTFHVISLCFPLPNLHITVVLAEKQL